MGCTGSSSLKSVIKVDICDDEQLISKNSVKLNDINELILYYNSKDCKKGDKIKLFGEEFVKNNKDKCKILFQKTEYDLVDYFKLPEINNAKTIEIQLNGIKDVTNISGMFSYNYKLLSSNNISEWNTINIKDMSRAFSGCFNLPNLTGISKWNIHNVENMSEMFANCEDSEKLPDISKWNTSKVKNMNKLFYNCMKLKKLPDISLWNTNNVTEMKSLFERCESLKSLPNISNWNTGNVVNMELMFGFCSSLDSIPDISKWNTSNVNEEQKPNINSILTTLLVFQFEILGNDFKDSHLSNKLFISVTLLVFQCEISGSSFNFIQL